MTVFKAALGLCGLSLPDAAEFLGVGTSTVKQYSAGNRPVPAHVWNMLAPLYAQIVDLSEHALDTFEMDELTPDNMAEIAKHEYGETLPAPAMEAAAAMFFLTRMTDGE